MEKLIELLNEFNPSMEWRMEDWVLESKLNFPAEYVAYRWICSKNYWFIEWLVEEDKIDYMKLVENYTWNELKEKDFTNDYVLLMYLSIQDEPIEFLISILKNV